jgi:hypothetical protein
MILLFYAKLSLPVADVAVLALRGDREYPKGQEQGHVEDERDVALAPDAAGDGGGDDVVLGEEGHADVYAVAPAADENCSKPS